ncbi:MAG: LPS export ABC transporter periplasmic protein LptC [Chlorobiaceae bacterium]|nr:LPS export ABC transporter periplasmic protein LptC [Chlorobiaceae bacterium]MBA4310027.1 LPS export ABC transporter periplasmic protein LptC [Chlorobiaceae bacterium]
MKKIIFLFVGLIIFSGCGNDSIKPPVSEIKIAELPAQESWNSTIVFTDSGRTQAIVQVGHLRSFTNAQETLIDDNLKIDFYDNNEIVTSTLKSRRGRVDDKTKDLYAYEDVKVVNNEGTTITTEELMWRNSDSKIVSNKFVTIISPTEKIQGFGFESDQYLRNYVIYRITYITNIDTLR